MGVTIDEDRRHAPSLVASEPDEFLMPRPSDMRYRWVCVRLDALDVEELQRTSHAVGNERLRSQPIGWLQRGLSRVRAGRTCAGGPMSLDGGGRLTGYG